MVVNTRECGKATSRAGVVLESGGSALDAVEDVVYVKTSSPDNCLVFGDVMACLTVSLKITCLMFTMWL